MFSLLKLAKELKKRNALREEDMSRKEELERKAEHDRMLTDERAKHAKELFETENRIAELKKAHASQCDDLCREVLKANLEADRLHGQLNDGTVRQTNFLSNSKKPARSFFKRAGPFLAFWLILVSLFAAVSAPMAWQCVVCRSCKFS